MLADELDIDTIAIPYWDNDSPIYSWFELDNIKSLLSLLPEELNTVEDESLALSIFFPSIFNNEVSK